MSLRSFLNWLSWLDWSKRNILFTCSKHNYTGINQPCPDSEKAKSC